MAKRVAILFGLLLVVFVAAAGFFMAWLAGSADDPAFFDFEILGFEDEDRAQPPPTDAVIFYGSSSIRYWAELTADMAPLPVLNRGFGGAHMSHLVHNVHRVVTPHRPAALVVYAGDNDLSAGTNKTPERVLADYRTLVAEVHARSPETRIYFLSIKASPLRWQQWPRMRDANAQIAEWSAQHPKLEYVDLADALMGDDGLPDDGFFVFDGLHLNRQGYLAWSEVLAPLLRSEFSSEPSPYPLPRGN